MHVIADCCKALEYGLPILSGMANIPTVKTTLDLSDELLVRAKRLARQTGRPLRAVVEEGLRLALGAAARPGRYTLPDCSVGDPRRPNPLEGMSWQDLRDEIYGGR